MKTLAAAPERMGTDPMARAERIRRVVRALLERDGGLERGQMVILARLYGVSRERVRQLKESERKRMRLAHRKKLSVAGA